MKAHNWKLIIWILPLFIAHVVESLPSPSLNQIANVASGLFGICYSEQDGTVFAISSDCNAYIYCLGQQDLVVPCPLGQRFSGTARGCVAEDTVDCVEQLNSWPLIVESTNATCIDNIQSHQNQVMCINQPYGELVPYPNDCNLFLLCDCLFPTVKMCPDGLWFDNTTKQCDNQQKVNCSIYMTLSTTAISTTSYITTLSTQHESTNSMSTDADPIYTERSTLTPENPVFDCEAPAGIAATFCLNIEDGTVHQYLYNCNAYVNCTLGCPILNYCELQKVFNPLLLICDTVDADCEELPLPEGTTTLVTTDSECGSPPPGVDASYCETPHMYYYSYQYDCEAYILCQNDCIELKYCPTGKLYNAILHICDTPESVSCIVSPVSPYTTVSPTAAPDECINLPDFTFLPFADDCMLFIECVEHKAILHQCPDHLLFNPNLLVCDDRNNVACIGDNSTTTPVPESTKPTTTLTTATTADLFIDCIEQKYGTSIPYVHNCQWYYYCWGNGSYAILPCPKDNWYDPYSADCGPNVSPTACQTPPTINKLNTMIPTLSPDELCADKELGNSFPLESNCQQYILCLGDGQSAIVNCIYNTWYNPQTESCGQDVAPTACREQDSNTSTFAPSTQSTIAEPPTTDVCNTSDGNIVSYPDNCSKYIVCVSPVPIAFFCTSGYYFNVELQQCVSWEDSDCEHDGTTTLLPGLTKPPPTPTECTNSTRDTFPYPDNCQWFKRCVNDYVFMMGVCSSAEYYDPWTGECGTDVSPNACREGSESTTSLSSTYSTTKPSTQSTPSPPSGPCEGVEEGKLVPYPYDCTKFIKCDSPVAVTYDCVEGQEFSAELERCMAPWIANCTTKPTAATPTVVITTQQTPGATPSTPDEICVNKEIDSLIPYPNNCSKYIVCQEPIPVGYDCPELLEFSPTELRCMERSLAKCNFVLEVSTTTSPSTTMLQADGKYQLTVPSASCAVMRAGTQLIYPGDCRRYLLCFGGQAAVLNCANDWVYNPEMAQCVPPTMYLCPWSKTHT